MRPDIILASGSDIRRALLTNAGVPFRVEVARVDEDMIRASMSAEGATPREVVDALAEAKAMKAGNRNPEALTIGCDQVLEIDGEILTKPASLENAAQQLARLNGTKHRLMSAAVICTGGKPVWRHIGMVRLQMHQNSDAYLTDYLTRNWESIRHSVGCYKLEEEGIRLFDRVDGDYFSVLGLPMVELLGYLRQTEALPG